MPVMVDYQRSSTIQRRVATRALARYYPWVLGGLSLLYIVTFPIIRAPMLIVLPVVAAGWFYYRRAGLVASGLSIFVNPILNEIFDLAPEQNILAGVSMPLLIGTVFLFVTSLGIGYLREVIENLYRREQLLLSEERFLALLGIMIKKILERSTWSAIHEDRSSHLFFDIIHHLTNLFVADSGRLIGWDTTPARAFLIASTDPVDIPSSPTPLHPVDLRIIMQALQTGQILAIGDLSESPYGASASEANLPPRTVRAALCIPIMAREYKFGAAILAYQSRHHFTSQEIQFAERVGHQVALALWGVRQDQINIQQLNKTQVRVKVGQSLSETERIGLDTVLQLIVDSARKLIPQAERAVIHLVDAEQELLVARAISGFEQNRMPDHHLKMHLGHGVAGQVLRDGVAINIGNLHTDTRFLQAGEQPSYASLLVAALQTSGRQLGTISVESQNTYAFAEHEADLLEALGSQAAIAIENTRLFENSARSLQELGALYRINQRLVASLDPDILIKEVVNLLQESFQYYFVEVFLMDSDRHILMLSQGSGEIGSQLHRMHYSLLPDEGIVGYAARSGKHFMTNNVEEVAFYVRAPLLEGVRSELAVPIKINDEVLGVLAIHQTDTRRLTERDLNIANAVAEQLAVALQKANLYANLETALEHEQTMRSQLVQSERLSLMGKLLASVSHELNNPLQTIQNALFLIRDDLHQRGIQLEEMDIISSEIDRMALLLERLRATYRPLHPGDFGPVQINDLIEDTHKLLSAYLRQKAIHFEFYPDPHVPLVRGLSNHLRQVLLNLFINAVEAMPDGGHFCAETFVVAASREVAFSIMDTGTGIQPDVLPRIFDPFVTNKKSGTGLGLTITHEIVEQHHGRILAENVPGHGAKLTVWLPTWKEASA